MCLMLLELKSMIRIPNTSKIRTWNWNKEDMYVIRSSYELWDVYMYKKQPNSWYVNTVVPQNTVG